MRAAYIEQTGPPEVIKVGDLPRPEPGPGQVLVRVRAVALNPIDLYIRSGLVAMPLAFPYIIGCDLAGTVEKVGPGVHAVRVGRSRLGLEPGAARPPGRRRGIRGRRRGLALSRRPPCCRTPRPRRWPWSGSRPTSGLFQFGQLKTGELGLRPRRHRRRRLDGRPDGQGGRGPRRDRRRQPRAARALPPARAPTWPSTTRPTTSPARLREFAPEGIDVWYETQREPNLEVSIPLLRKNGRMILIAGRTAKPALPLGAFYPRNCAHLRLRHVQRHRRRSSAGAPIDMIRWIEEGQLKAARRPDLPARRRRRGRCASSKKTP